VTRRPWNIRVATCSERGATHERRKLPNQDAAAYWPSSGVATQVVIAVADGHGSPKSFRSATGAQLAVKSAADAGREWLSRPPPDKGDYVGDQTASLAMSDPFPDFRGAVVRTRRPSPLTLLATDGYSKSFETEDGFWRVGSDLVAVIDAEGFDAGSKLLAE